MLDLTDPSLSLSFSPIPFHILRLARSTSIPAPIISLFSLTPQPPFLSISLSPTETSIILPTSSFNALSISHTDPSKTSAPNTCASEGPWSLLKVEGPMKLHLTGILHALIGPLKEEGVAIFASSTYDTDYVLVHEVDREKAEGALKKAGWVFI